MIPSDEMRLSHAGTSDVGRKRTHNEDAFLLLPEESLFCVADGMGGHASGEVAARIAVEEMAEFFRTTGQDEEATWPYKLDPARGYDENRLLTGVKLANLRIFERAASDAQTVRITRYPISTDACPRAIPDMAGQSTPTNASIDSCSTPCFESGQNRFASAADIHTRWTSIATDRTYHSPAAAQSAISANGTITTAKIGRYM